MPSEERRQMLGLTVKTEFEPPPKKVKGGKVVKDEKGKEKGGREGGSKLKRMIPLR